MIPPVAAADALFLDFDGTLAEIAATPSAVKVDPRVPTILNRLQSRLGGALAVVSGRRMADLVALLGPYTGALAGIHGLERREPDGRIVRPDPLPVMGHARRVLATFAARNPGIEIEDKELSIAIHFRANPEKALACLQLAREVAWLSGQRLTLSQGKMVVELHPAGANKGRVILEFLNEPPFRGRRPIFVGDDQPDESGFVFVNHLGGTTVLVGSSDTSTAKFRLPSVSAVIGWLARSISTPPPGPGALAAS